MNTAQFHCTFANTICSFILSPVKQNNLKRFKASRALCPVYMYLWKYD